MRKRILVIDDEKPIRTMLRVSLEAAGYEVAEASTAEEGLRSLVYPVPDLVLLDLVLPDGNGVDILRRVREFSRVPMIVISALGGDAEKIALLDAGADDYLTKPFSVGELLARIRVGLRHTLDPKEEITYEAGPLVLDPAQHELLVRGKPVHLTPTEYAILLLFFQHRDRVLTREQIIQRVWGTDENETGSLRVHIFQLRKKIADAAEVTGIETLPGVGYRLTVHES